MASHDHYTEFAVYLEHLQDRVDLFRRQRGWLLFAWLIGLGLAILLLGLTMGGLVEIWLAALIALPTFGTLIYQTIQHEGFARALEAEVSRLPYRQLAGDYTAGEFTAGDFTGAKPKRKRQSRARTISDLLAEAAEPLDEAPDDTRQHSARR